MYDKMKVSLIDKLKHKNLYTGLEFLVVPY